MGKLIVFDGLDGSGKGTQSTKLCTYLNEKNIKATKISFPMYENISSSLVKLYLSGGLGDNPLDTNSFAASSLFALDRYVSYRTDWGKLYSEENSVIICDRYTTANAIHQLAKLPKKEWDHFLNWLWDFEFNKLQLPKPDIVIYLEMTPELSFSLIEGRSKETGRQKDIHETKDFLIKSYEAALFAAENLDWVRIPCHEDGVLRSWDEILDEIIKKTEEVL